MLDNDESGKFMVTLINYSSAKKISEKPESYVANFEGNILFASADHLNYKATTPKDDLISLMYLMIYILNDKNLPTISQHTVSLPDDPK